MSQLLNSFVISTVASIIGIGVIVFSIDPWVQFDSPTIAGLNASKPELRSHELIYKFQLSSRQVWNTILLGTSRVKHGIDPTLSFPNDTAVANLGSNHQAYEISYLLYERTLGKSKASLKRVIWGVDFFEANATYFVPTLPQLSAVERPWEALFSISALGASINTLALNLWETISTKGKVLQSGQYNLKNGFQVYVPTASPREEAIWSDWLHASKIYLPPPQRKFVFSTADRNPLDYVRTLIRSAYAHDIEVVLFISPSHARQWEVIDCVGLWETWEQWKRMLVRLVEDEAISFGRPAFKVYDFSGYGTINAEKFPPLDDKQSVVENYFEPNHYRPSVGKLVTDRILGNVSSEQFGWQLTSANVEAHLASIRRDRASWRIANDDEFQEVRAICQKAILTLKPTLSQSAALQH